MHVPETHETRRDRLRRRFLADGADAALVTTLVNVRYLTGFTGSNAALLVTEGHAVLATDGRYTTQAAAQSPDVERLIDRACAAALVARAGRDRVGRLAFEAQDVTVEDHEALSALDGAPHLAPLGRVVEDLRTVKDEAEIALVARACAVSDEALTGLCPTVRPGRTERDVARDLEHRMLAAGADFRAFETIVASGPNSAIPHHRPTDRVIEAGDLLTIDFGALVAGYHADCTRTFVVGREPADWQREIHDVVRRAQRAGRHALVPGAGLREVDSAARDVVAAAGYAEAFPHGLGHGVGLEIHEAPMFGQQSTGKLESGSPVTVEPGVYLPGRGGVRIEDTLVVREDGADLLTTTPKDLLVL